MKNNKLQKSAADRKLSGVCGGIGESLGIDPFIIRVFFCLFSLFLGTGVFLYSLFYITMPCEMDQYHLFH